MTDFSAALAVADAVLYEGYLLYPYTASAPKNRNRVRWQFGVVMPRAYVARDSSERSTLRTELLLECDGATEVELRLRYLHVDVRTVDEVRADGTFAAVDLVEAAGERYVPFDEAAPSETAVVVRPADAASVTVPIAAPATRTEEPIRDAAGTVVGRIVRERAPLAGRLTVSTEPVDGLPNVALLRVLAENESPLVGDGDRPDALKTAFIAAHALFGVTGGAFLSVLDPPDAAVAATERLENRDAFPVLVGDGDADAQRASLVLASPIILYDFPKTSPKIASDAFDATEIDELLMLSVRSLSEEERAEARATDPLARAIVERAERFDREDVSRLHDGALTGDGVPVFAEVPPRASRSAQPFFGDPFAAVDVPAIDCVFVAGTKVMRGSSVRLHPKRRADAWDMFLRERVATVRAVHRDLEDVEYVAVTVDEDPASDLHDWYGRSFFFYPDEIEPLAAEGVS